MNEILYFELNQMADAAKTREMFNFLEKNHWAIVSVPESLLHGNDESAVAKLLREISLSTCVDHNFLVLTVNGSGNKNFAKKFHRSRTYVSSRVFDKQATKAVFSEQFIKTAVAKFGSIHVRGAKEIIPRTN